MKLFHKHVWKVTGSIFTKPDSAWTHVKGPMNTVEPLIYGYTNVSTVCIECGAVNNQMFIGEHVSPPENWLPELAKTS